LRKRQPERRTRAALIVEDIISGEAPRRIGEAAAAALGKVEILVNCAGGSRPLPVDAPVSPTSPCSSPRRAPATSPAR